MTLATQLRAALAFDEMANLSERANWGRSLEHARLAPLLEALVKLAEAAETFTCADANANWQASSRLSTALSELKKAVGE